MKPLSLLFTIGLVVTGPALACRVPMPNENRIREADVVLTGTVTASRLLSGGDETTVQAVEVEVVKVLKGKTAVKVEAVAICAPAVQTGKRIVILGSNGQLRAYQGEHHEAVVRKAFGIAETPKTRFVCERSGGNWGRYGLLVREECDMPTSDAGRGCSSSSQCQSVCVASQNAPKGRKMVGQCFGRTMTRGTCLNYVRDGIVQGFLCND